VDFQQENGDSWLPTCVDEHGILFGRWDREACHSINRAGKTPHLLSSLPIETTVADDGRTAASLQSSASLASRPVIFRVVDGVLCGQVDAGPLDNKCGPTSSGLLDNRHRRIWRLRCAFSLMKGPHYKCGTIRVRDATGPSNLGTFAWQRSTGVAGLRVVGQDSHLLGPYSHTTSGKRRVQFSHGWP